MGEATVNQEPRTDWNPNPSLTTSNLDAIGRGQKLEVFAMDMHVILA
jgi:hypothetical protein